MAKSDYGDIQIWLQVRGRWVEVQLWNLQPCCLPNTLLSFLLLISRLLEWHATNSQYEQCLFRIMRDVSWCHNYNINCSNRKTRAKFPGSLVKCIFILTKIDETPLQVAERLGHHHVKTYLLRLAGEVTDVQSDGTDLDISVNGKSYISSWERTIRKKKGEVWGDYSTLRVLVCLVYIVLPLLSLYVFFFCLFRLYECFSMWIFHVWIFSILSPYFSSGPSPQS